MLLYLHTLSNLPSHRSICKLCSTFFIALRWIKVRFVVPTIALFVALASAQCQVVDPCYENSNTCMNYCSGSKTYMTGTCSREVFMEFWE